MLEIKSLDTYPELNLDDDVYEQASRTSLVEGQFSRLFLLSQETAAAFYHKMVSSSVAM